MKPLLVAILSIIAINSFAQPYVDPFHLRYTYAFKNNSGSGTSFNHLFIGPDLPLKLKNNGLFVISPVYENSEKLKTDNSFQLGGLLLATYKKKGNT